MLERVVSLGTPELLLTVQPLLRTSLSSLHLLTMSVSTTLRQWDRCQGYHDFQEAFGQADSRSCPDPQVRGRHWHEQEGRVGSSCNIQDTDNSRAKTEPGARQVVGEGREGEESDHESSIRA